MPRRRLALSPGTPPGLAGLVLNVMCKDQNRRGVAPGAGDTSAASGSAPSGMSTSSSPSAASCSAARYEAAIASRPHAAGSRPPSSAPGFPRASRWRQLATRPSTLTEPMRHRACSLRMRGVCGLASSSRVVLPRSSPVPTSAGAGSSGEGTAQGCCTRTRRAQARAAPGHGPAPQGGAAAVHSAVLFSSSASVSRPGRQAARERAAANDSRAERCPAALRLRGWRTAIQQHREPGTMRAPGQAGGAQRAAPPRCARRCELAERISPTTMSARWKIAAECRARLGMVHALGCHSAPSPRPPGLPAGDFGASEGAGLLQVCTPDGLSGPRSAAELAASGTRPPDSTDPHAAPGAFWRPQTPPMPH